MQLRYWSNWMGITYSTEWNLERRGYWFMFLALRLRWGRAPTEGFYIRISWFASNNSRGLGPFLIEVNSWKKLLPTSIIRRIYFFVSGSSGAHGPDEAGFALTPGNARTSTSLSIEELKIERKLGLLGLWSLRVLEWIRSNCFSAGIWKQRNLANWEIWVAVARPFDPIRKGFGVLWAPSTDLEIRVWFEPVSRPNELSNDSIPTHSTGWHWSDCRVQPTMTWPIRFGGKADASPLLLLSYCPLTQLIS